MELNCIYGTAISNAYDVRVLAFSSNFLDFPIELFCDSSSTGWCATNWKIDKNYLLCLHLDVVRTHTNDVMPTSKFGSIIQRFVLRFLKVLCIKQRKIKYTKSHQIKHKETIIITSKVHACLIRLQQVRNFQKKIYRWLSTRLSLRLLNVLAASSWYHRAASWIEILNEITCVYGWFLSLIFIKMRGTEKTLLQSA